MSRKRGSRKVAGGGSGAAGKDSGRNSIDVLDSSILSPKVWEALSKIFQTQFATILPFIDSTTLKHQAVNLSVSQADAPSSFAEEEDIYLKEEPPHDQDPTPPSEL